MRKIRFILKFMTLQLGSQTISIHILPNITQNKSNPTMKFGQLIEYKKRNIFLQKFFRKRGMKTISRPFLFFKKA